MSWFTAEAAGKRATDLFTFTRGEEVWRYAHSPRDVTVGGLVYRGAAIKRSAPTQDGEAQASAIHVTLTDRSAIAVMLRAAGPYARPLYGSIARIHSGETEVKIFWSGEVAEIEFAEGTVTLAIASIRTMLQRPLGRMKIQPRCNNTVFDHHCGLDQRDWAVAGTLSAFGTDVRLREVTVEVEAAYETGYFAGGRLVLDGVPYYVELSTAGGEETAPFTQQLVLLQPPAPDTPRPAAVTLYPGCDGRIETCRDKFQNRQNFTGFPSMPQRNPLNKDNS